MGNSGLRRSRRAEAEWACQTKRGPRRRRPRRPYRGLWSDSRTTGARATSRRRWRTAPTATCDCDGDRLVTVRLEGLELVQLERSGEASAGEMAGLDVGGVAGQPGETMFHGAPGDAQDPGRLPQADAGDHEVEAGGVDVGLLLT